MFIAAEMSFKWCCDSMEMKGHNNYSVSPVQMTAWMKAVSLDIRVPGKHFVVGYKATSLQSYGLRQT